MISIFYMSSFRMLKRINSPVPLYRRWKLTKSVRVGSIVIGDEILKGYVNDTNTHFLAKKCFRAGIKLGHSLELIISLILCDS